MHLPDGRMRNRSTVCRSCWYRLTHTHRAFYCMSRVKNVAFEPDLDGMLPLKFWCRYHTTRTNPETKIKLCE